MSRQTGMTWLACKGVIDEMLRLSGVDLEEARKKESFGLGQYDRDMGRVKASTAQLHQAHQTAATELSAAREAISKGPSHVRAAKDRIINAHNALKSAAESGRLTASTSGRAISSLPRYGDENHPHMKAHAANQQHSELVDKTERMRRSLSHGTIGDHERVSKALADYDAEHK